MKKTSKLNVEYAVLTINTDNIEERSEANISLQVHSGNERCSSNFDGEFIRSHWQKNITKHQPPIIRTMEDLERLKIDEKT